MEENKTGFSIGLPLEAEGVSGYISSFLHWEKTKNIRSKPSRWYCDKYKITGECDGIYFDDVKPIIFDLKTSSKYGETWKYQGAAYAYLAKQAGYDIKRLEFVHLQKNGKPAISYFFDDFEKDFEMFLKCLEVYRHFYGDGKEGLTEADYL